MLLLFDGGIYTRIFSCLVQNMLHHDTNKNIWCVKDELIDAELTNIEVNN
jgi:hypothetical protein